MIATSLFRNSLVPALAALVLIAAPPARSDVFRVTTWNVMAYPDVDLAGRQPHIRTVFGTLPAEILVAHEVRSAAGAESLLTALATARPIRWGMGYVPGAAAAVYWDSSRVTISGVTGLATSGPREVLQCIAQPFSQPASWAFRIYAIHPAEGNPVLRGTECGELRDHLNTLPANSNFLVGGTVEFGSSSDPGYVRLTGAEADNDGRATDLLNLSGAWGQAMHAYRHTTSPCKTGCPGDSGGLNRRHDLWLISPSLASLTQPLAVGNFAYGNDGHHYSAAVDSGTNNIVGPVVAAALARASDHLPVVFTLEIPQPPGSFALSASQVDLGRAYVGPTSLQSSYTARYSASPGSAPLTYSIPSALPDFGVGPGNHQLFPNQTRLHPVTLFAQTVGLKDRILVVTPVDPPVDPASIRLFGRVLRHPQPSFDSLSVTSAVVNFGTHEPGEFTERTIRLHNYGFDGLQGLLYVDSVGVEEGDGRFSFTWDGSTTPLGAVGRTYTVAFDPTGATRDSVYVGALVLHLSEEVLPNTTALDSARVTLLAKVGTESTTGRDDSPSAALRFAAPIPNPAGASTEFAFELPFAGRVTLDVFDSGGRRVARPIAGEFLAGTHRVRWTANDDRGRRLRAGLYFAHFRARNAGLTRRIVILP